MTPLLKPVRRLCQRTHHDLGGRALVAELTPGDYLTLHEAGRRLKVTVSLKDIYMLALRRQTPLPPIRHRRKPRLVESAKTIRGRGALTP